MKERRRRRKKGQVSIDFVVRLLCLAVLPLCPPIRTKRFASKLLEKRFASMLLLLLLLFCFASTLTILSSFRRHFERAVVCAIESPSLTQIRAGASSSSSPEPKAMTPGIFLIH
jgi:hypothetical protein